MATSPLRYLVLSLFISVSAHAATSDLTLPSFGRVTLPHVKYSSEIVITNHRDQSQRVEVHFIGREDVGSGYVEMLTIGARQSMLKTDFLERNLFGGRDGVGAIRLVSVTPDNASDPEGQIDARIFVIAERPDGGTSRQEVHPVASGEYFAERATFAGIRHDDRAYTNVGIANLSPTLDETFHIDIEGHPWIEVRVPALRVVQVRLPIAATTARTLKIHPNWAVTLADPAIPKPWVAYASTVDGLTGDCWTAHRLPPDIDVR